MSARLSFISILVLFILCVYAKSKLKYSDELEHHLDNLEENKTSYLWIYLLDKDQNLKKTRAIDVISVDAITRRRKTSMPSELAVEVDLPVNSKYVDLILGQCPEYTKLRATSRWMNSISIELKSPNSNFAKECIEKISHLPFVVRMDTVTSSPRDDDSSSSQPSFTISNQPKSLSKRAQSNFDYGISLPQLEQIGVPELHDRGLSGAGVKILILDSGFYKSHSSLPYSQVIAEYDFVAKDNQTGFQAGDNADQDKHGTSVFSLLAGKANGTLWGPAFGASFLLAKTEDLTIESVIEEDYFVEALEWGESKGADIVTASLGYKDWYKPSDFDGKTAITTKAVNIAVELGVVVVVSVGNAANKGMTAPADSNCIAVGAVNAGNEVATFSSRGPTADGRIKPDLVAKGVDNVVASTSGSLDFTLNSGTSMSAPLVSGVIALLLEQHPTWTPAHIQQALKSTADRSNDPNNEKGWGLINAVAAIDFAVQDCPNDCNIPHGKCENNRCVCYLDYYSFDCSAQKSGDNGLIMPSMLLSFCAILVLFCKE